MKQVTPSQKTFKSFQGQSFSTKKSQSPVKKPRAIKNPGARSGLKKGAGG